MSAPNRLNEPSVCYPLFKHIRDKFRLVLTDEELRGIVMVCKPLVAPVESEAFMVAHEAWLEEQAKQCFDEDPPCPGCQQGAPCDFHTRVGEHPDPNIG